MVLKMNLLSNNNLNGELVFKNIEQKLFENVNAPKLIIKNSIVKNCDFINVNLGHCDLLSSKLYNVSFKNVSFSCADIYSLWFSECKFDSVNFSGAGIGDISFIDCDFIDCKYEDAGLNNCIFSNCHFKNINLVSAGFTLNQYNECKFTSCKFTSSFHYQIFHRCDFDNVEMEYSLLKYNFGIGVKGIKYVKNEIPFENQEKLFELLSTECVVNNLFLNAVFVNFNMSSSINPQLILKSIDAIELLLSRGILIRSDEIFFLKKLYQFMYEKQMMSPILLYQLLDKLKNFNILEKSDIAYVKSRESLSMIYNDLYFNFFMFCDKLQQNLDRLPQFEVPLNYSLIMNTSLAYHLQNY